MNPEAPIGKIEAVIATHYDECSLAASAAYRGAKAIAQSREFTAKKIDIIEGYPTDPGVLTETATTKLSDRLHLEKRGDCTRLLYKIEDRLAIPVATFVPRVGSQCSYVQLGEEMINENIVIGSRDTRMPIVEDIRKLFNGTEEQHTRNLSEFIQKLLSDCSTEIALRVPISRARSVQRMYESSEKKKLDLFLVDPGSDPHSLTGFDAVLLTLPHVGAYAIGNREVELYFGRPSNEIEADLSLLLVTRGNVGFTAAQITRNHQWVSPLIDDNSDYDDNNLSKDILTLTKEAIERKSELSSIGRKGKKAENILRKLCEKDLVKSHSTRVDLSGKLNEISTKSRFGKKLISLSNLIQLPQRNSLNITYFVLSIPDSFITLTAAMGFREHLDTQLGLDSSSTEAVLNKLRILTDNKAGEFQGYGIYPNRTIRDTKTDLALHVRARRLQAGSAFLLHIATRPRDHEDIDFTTVFKGQVNRTRASEFTIEDFNEINEALSYIK